MIEGNVLSELPDEIELFVTRWRDAQIENHRVGFRVTAGDYVSRDQLVRFLEVLVHDVRKGHPVEMVVVLDRSRLP